MKILKIILYILITAIITIVLYEFYVYQKNEEIEILKNETSTKVYPIEKIDIPPKKNTKIYFVGDIMLDRGVLNSVRKNFNNDFNLLFENLNELKDADILFGNLEGPVSDLGNNVGSKYSFRMDTSVLNALENAGFDILSFSNNHVGDWNVSAFLDTLKRFKVSKILLSGAGVNSLQSNNPSIIERNNIKFGFLSMSDVGPKWLESSENSPGILLASNPLLSDIVKNAKSKSDFLIVSIHFGDEYKTFHNKRQESLARSMIDSGADLIIGHHPHVIQDIEIYKGKTIVYSLGNFIFDQYFSENTMEGMLFEANFLDNNLIETKVKKIKLNKKFQPTGVIDFND